MVFLYKNGNEVLEKSIMQLCNFNKKLHKVNGKGR